MSANETNISILVVQVGDYSIIDEGEPAIKRLICDSVCGLTKDLGVTGGYWVRSGRRISSWEEARDLAWCLLIGESVVIHAAKPNGLSTVPNYAAFSLD